MAKKPASEDKLAEDFTLAYGKALAQWAQVEQRLFFWFEHLTRMPHAMARAVFYSARSYTGRHEMLVAVIGQHPQTSEEIEFIREAALKCLTYNSFRNKLAHGEMIVGHQDGVSRVLLTQGKDFISPEKDIDVAQLRNAAKNFGALANALTHGWLTARRTTHPNAKPLPECRALLDALPNQPSSATLSQKQRGRLRQRQSSPRKS